MYEESLKVLDEGQVLTGVIVAKYQDELLVDIGGKSEGFLSFRELSLAIEPKELKVGDKLEVMIHRIDEEGTLFLSERRARALKTWEKVIAAHDNDEVIEATVTQVVKGGVLVDLGMRGFVPASQIRRQPVGNLEELVGKHLRLKVIDLDHKRHRVVLSQRLVLEEELNAKKSELLGTLAVGQIREGVVVRLAEFGAFVDLGGIDGLIHNSELSYARIKHPSEVVKIGDVVHVEVMKFDPDAKKVSLSLKHALPDPWVEHADKLTEGQRLIAQVVKVTPNYLLVEIIPGVLAMVPKGEFDPQIQYSPGQEVEVTLLDDQPLDPAHHGLDPACCRRAAGGACGIRRRGRPRFDRGRARALHHRLNPSGRCRKPRRFGGAFSLPVVVAAARSLAEFERLRRNGTGVRLRVGLTGGIGSGKSEVARVFSDLGALVIDADALARDAVLPRTEAYRRIARRWPQAVGADGTLDRAALGAIVFRDSAARDELAAIVHPEVRRLGAEREATAGPEQIVVHDVPLLFEAGFYRQCDATVLVVADRETRIGRVVARSGLEPAEVERRMNAQIDPERARELADYTIDNDGTIGALFAATRDVYDDLLQRVPAVSRPAPRRT